MDCTKKGQYKVQQKQDNTVMLAILDLAWTVKLKWVRKGAEMKRGRWSKVTTEWVPLDQRRALGRLCMRWEDQLACDRLGRTPTAWMRQARKAGEEWIGAMGAARKL